MQREPFPLPRANIEWQAVRDEWNTRASAGRDKPEIEERKTVFLYYRPGGSVPDALVFWCSRTARKAQRWLKSVSFARCSRSDCGIRLSEGQKFGDECGNHK